MRLQGFGGLDHGLKTYVCYACDFVLVQIAAGKQADQRCQLACVNGRRRLGAGYHGATLLSLQVERPWRYFFSLAKAAAIAPMDEGSAVRAALLRRGDPAPWRLSAPGRVSPPRRTGALSSSRRMVSAMRL